MRGFAGLVFVFLLSCGGARVQPPSLEVDAVLESEKFAVPVALAAAGEPNPKFVESDLLLATDYAVRHPGASEAFSRALLSRSLLENLRSEASRVPPSESEMAALRAKLWLEIDRPPSLRYLSALVQLEPLEPDADAFELATKIAETTRGDLSPRDFVNHAEELARGANLKFEVHVPVSAEGRSVPTTSEDAELPELPREARALVSKLFEVSAVSGVIGAREGFYVLYGIEMLPGLRRSEEEARPLLEAALLEERLRAPLEKLRAELRKTHAVSRSSRLNELLPLAWNTR